ncbi:MAG: hypothetical protein AAFP69_17995 [Planctomycetota bacterium]
MEQRFDGSIENQLGVVLQISAVTLILGFLCGFVAIGAVGYAPWMGLIGPIGIWVCLFVAGCTIIHAQNRSDQSKCAMMGVVAVFASISFVALGVGVPLMMMIFTLLIDQRIVFGTDSSAVVWAVSLTLIAFLILFVSLWMFAKTTSSVRVSPASQAESPADSD